METSSDPIDLRAYYRELNRSQCQEKIKEFQRDYQIDLLQYPPDIWPDPDQIKVITSSHPQILVEGGPGSGKTEILCSYLFERSKESSSDLRVLFLIHNPVLRKKICSRLKEGYHLPVNSKKRIHNPGISVLTYRDYVNHIRGIPKEGDYGKPIQEAIWRGASSREHWDYVIVDQAQDVTFEIEKLIQQAQSKSKHMVVAGDRKQQIVNKAGGYITHLRRNHTFKKYHLRYNHRTLSQVVDYFGYQEISTREGSGGVQICQGSFKKCYQRVAELFLQEGKDNIYLITPVQTRGWNEFVSKVQIQLGDDGKDIRRLYTGNLKYEPHQNPGYYIGTPENLAGTEKAYVIVYHPRDYEYLPQFSNKLYLALSRARDRLTVLVPDQE